MILYLRHALSCVFVTLICLASVSTKATEEAIDLVPDSQTIINTSYAQEAFKGEVYSRVIALFAESRSMEDTVCEVLEWCGEDPRFRATVPGILCDIFMGQHDDTEQLGYIPNSTILGLVEPNVLAMWQSDTNIVLYNTDQEEVIGVMQIPTLEMPSDMYTIWIQRCRMLHVASLMGNLRARTIQNAFTRLYDGVHIISDVIPEESKQTIRKARLDNLRTTDLGIFSDELNFPSAIISWLRTRRVFLESYADQDDSTDNVARFVHEALTSQIFPTSFWSSLAWFKPQIEIETDCRVLITDEQASLLATEADAILTLLKRYITTAFEHNLFSLPMSSIELDSTDDDAKEVAINEGYFKLHSFVREYIQFIEMLFQKLYFDKNEFQAWSFYKLVQGFHDFPHNHDRIVAAFEGNSTNIEIYYASLFKLMKASQNAAMIVWSLDSLKTDRFSEEQLVPTEFDVISRLTQKISVLKDILDNFIPGQQIALQVLIQIKESQLQDLIQSNQDITFQETRPSLLGLRCITKEYKDYLEMTSNVSQALEIRMSDFVTDLAEGVSKTYEDLDADLLEKAQMILYMNQNYNHIELYDSQES